jgi:hypothetical protein
MEYSTDTQICTHPHQKFLIFGELIARQRILIYFRKNGSAKPKKSAAPPITSARPALPEGVGAKGANPLESESEKDTILTPEAGSDRHILEVEAAAVPRPADGGREVDQIRIARQIVKSTITKIINDRKPPVRPT